MPEAARNLDRPFARGLGVPQSYSEAWFWLNVAAQRSAGAKHERDLNARNEAEENLTQVELDAVCMKQLTALDHPASE